MDKELVFITVIGKDRKGIVAKFSTYLYRSGINIEDISQRIMDKYFVMVMLVDTHSANRTLDRIGRDLARIGKSMNLAVQIQHENIFKMMHRI